MHPPRLALAALAALIVPPGAVGVGRAQAQATAPAAKAAGLAPPPPARPRGGEGWEFKYVDPPASGRGARDRLDLRGLNEKVAGESGFVRLSPDGNSFVLGSGAPARFWAVNSEVFRAPPEEIERNVRFLARVGVNMVRIHAQLSPKGAAAAQAGNVDEKELDGIWRYVAAAKAQGIYTTISPYWAHSVEAAKWGIDGYGNGELYGLLFFDESLQAAYRSWTKALLARTNPYTGIPLAKDAAVALLQIQNEDSLLFWTFDNMKPQAKARLAAKFGAWAAEKHGSAARAVQAWGNTLRPDDNPAAGRLGFFELWAINQQSGAAARRAADQAAFIAGLQREFYEATAAYFRKDLGCGQLINATNWRTADESKLDDLERWSYAGLDVVAANRYYQGGPHLGPNVGWRIDPGDKFARKSALFDPRALPFNLKQVAGHPTVVTESTWEAPISFTAEGPFLAAAYTSVTGVDAFYWFNDDSPEFKDNPFFIWGKVNGQDPLFKWSAMTPTIAGGFPAASVLFRKGYLKAGTPVIHEERSLASLWARQDPVIAEGPAFDPNRDPGVAPGAASSRRPGSKGADPLAFLAGPVEVAYAEKPGATVVSPELPKLIDAKRKVVRSITGEVTLDYGRGICRVDAPKAQGACGFFKDAGTIQLGDLAINSANSYAAILAVALDDAPLATSRRVLIQVTTANRPTGWATKPVEFAEAAGKPKVKGFEVTQTGKPPWHVADTEVGLSLKNPNLTKAIRHDPAGYPAGNIALTKSAAGVALTLPPDAMYVILE